MVYFGPMMVNVELQAAGRPQRRFGEGGHTEGWFMKRRGCCGAHHPWTSSLYFRNLILDITVHVYFYLIGTSLLYLDF